MTKIIQKSFAGGLDTKPYLERLGFTVEEMKFTDLFYVVIPPDYLKTETNVFILVIRRGLTAVEVFMELYRLKVIDLTPPPFTFREQLRYEFDNTGLRKVVYSYGMEPPTIPNV